MINLFVYPQLFSNLTIVTIQVPLCLFGVSVEREWDIFDEI